MSEELQALVESEVRNLGYELFELRTAGSKSRPTLDVRVDREDGNPVTVDDCARISRALEARLDASRVLGERYVLEVSSPGVERPLRTAAHWRRFVGKRVSVKSPAVGGRIEAENAGVVEENGSDVVVLRMPKGDEKRVPLADIKEARLVFEW